MLFLGLVQVCEKSSNKMFLKCCFDNLAIFYNTIDGFKVSELTLNELCKNLLMIQGGIE